MDRVVTTVPTSDPPATADVVVIGGGVIGTSIAYWLTERGRQPVLLERRGLATGASGKSAGLVRRHYTHRSDAALAQIGWQFFSRWAETIGTDCGFVRTGFLMLTSPERIDELRGEVDMLRSLGVGTRMLHPAEIREIDPALSTEGVGAGAFEPDSGYADPASVAAGFARGARNAGARICLGVAATDVIVDGERAMGVRTQHGTIATRTVVVACGPWSAAFAARAGFELPIRVKRVVEIFVRRPAGLRHVSVIDRVTGTYFRPEGRDVTLIGGRSDDWGTDPDHYDESVGLDIVEPAIARALTRLPGLAGAGLMRGVAGVDGYSEDRRQILGAVPGCEGLFVAAAGSGTAFKQSPAVGMCMAELICDGRATTVDLAPYDPARFSSAAATRSAQGARA